MSSNFNKSPFAKKLEAQNETKMDQNCDFSFQRNSGAPFDKDNYIMILKKALKDVIE